MELLQGEAFDDLFRTFTHSAFHLEVQDSYHTPEEAGPFHLFLTGQPDDLEWHRPWLELVREVIRAGRVIRRVRVVTVPHGDYTRWGLTVAPYNIAAGEDIRWLPRDLIGTDDMTADDYWLFDDDQVVFTIFERNGQFAGGASTTDPVISARCRTIRDRVWQAATPHNQYVTGQHIGA